MRTESLPSVSFVIPTFNASKTLRRCLESIFQQDYPRDKWELLIVDGGSTDETLAIAEQFPCRVLPNPTRYEEGPGGGKGIGFFHSRGELVVFVDSDNELASPQWLRNTVAPYQYNPEVVGTFAHIIPTSDGSLLSRYLTMANSQPFIRFWNPDDVVRLPQENPRFRIVKLNGACDLSNGASVRREVLERVGGYDYGIETTKRLVDAGHITFAWPNGTELYHHFVGATLRGFVRKRLSRLRRFQSWANQGLRSYTVSVYRPRSSDEYLRLWARVIKSLSFLTMPEAIWKGIRDWNLAWVYHPIVSFLDTSLHILLLRHIAFKVGAPPRRTT